MLEMHALIRFTLLASFLGVAACETYKERAPGDEAREHEQGAAPAKSDATCEQVAERIVWITLNQPGMDEARRAQAEALSERSLKVIAQTCEKTPWPADFRNCLVAAKSGQDIATCRTKFEPPSAPPPDRR
jgi:hypothetical protein